jgi:hypothetical protein
MKGIDSTGAALVHVPRWMDGWVGGCKSRFKDCLQQSKISSKLYHIVGDESQTRDHIMTWHFW